MRRGIVPSLPLFPLRRLSSHTPSLAAADLAEIHRLLPLLCDSGRLSDAIRLLSAALLAAPEPPSLPLAALSDRLSAAPDMAPSMSLLTALRHHPCSPSPLPFCAALLSAYARRRRPKEFAKVFRWLFRPDSPCRPDAEVYGIAVMGFCQLRAVDEALRAVREMVGDRVVPGRELRGLVFRGLLREARVDEAKELDGALKCVEESADGFDGACQVLDKLLREWEE